LNIKRWILKNKFTGFFKNQEIVLLLIFVVIFVILGFLRPQEFLGKYNLQSMASQFPELGIISLGMMVVILSGGIDLSIVSVSTLAGVTGAWIMTKWGPPVETGIEGLDRSTGSGALSGPVVIIIAIVAIFAVALICGFINGFFIVKVGITPILVTLATMTLFEGVSLYFTKGGSIAGLPPQFIKIANTNILNVPLLFIIFIVVAIIVGIFLERSSWGRSIYMLGSNPIASLFSGINTKRLTMSVYLFSAAMAAIAAIIISARYNSAKIGTGSSYILQSITIVVLGGTAISGGYGKVTGTVIALLIMQVLKSGLNIVGISQYITDIAAGVILIIVLISNLYIERTRVLKT